MLQDKLMLVSVCSQRVFVYALVRVAKGVLPSPIYSYNRVILFYSLTAGSLDESTLVKRFYRDQETKTESSSPASLPSKHSEVIDEGEISSDGISANLKEQLSVPRVVYKKEIAEQESSLVEMPAVYSRSEDKVSENDGMDTSDGGLDPDEPNIEIHERGIREDGKYTLIP